MSGPSWRRHRVIRPLAVAATLALVGAGLWLVLSGRPKLNVLSVHLAGVMGADAELAAVVAPGQEEMGQQAIEAARGELSRAAALMNGRDPHSEISRFNQAPAGQTVALSSETMEVLHLSRRLAADTGGAFDVTCRPLVVLWEKAAGANRLPTEADVAQARALVGWDKIELLDHGARKTIDGASIDLGGIATKYAIDRAVDAMRRYGLAGGMVSVGGDLRVFGRHRGGDVWEVNIPDPFGGRTAAAAVKVRDAAVCTSDNYARRYRIGEQWFTRVMDPRTGTPATTVASVTVVGAAATDGAWTTALGVLGPAGLDKLPASVQARVVTGEANNCQTYVSPGFARHASPVGGRTGGATAPTSTPATPSGAAPGHVGAFAGRDAPRYSRAGRPCYAGSAA